MFWNMEDSELAQTFLKDGTSGKLTVNYRRLLRLPKLSKNIGMR